MAISTWKNQATKTADLAATNISPSVPVLDLSGDDFVIDLAGNDSINSNQITVRESQSMTPNPLPKNSVAVNMLCDFVQMLRRESIEVQKANEIEDIVFAFEMTGDHSLRAKAISLAQDVDRALRDLMSGPRLASAVSSMLGPKEVVLDL